MFGRTQMRTNGERTAHVRDLFSYPDPTRPDPVLKPLLLAACLPAQRPTRELGLERRREPPTEPAVRLHRDRPRSSSAHRQAGR